MEDLLLIPPLVLESWRLFDFLAPMALVRQGNPMIYAPQFFELPIFNRRSACSSPFGTFIRYQYLADEHETEFVIHEGVHYAQWKECLIVLFLIVYLLELVVYSLVFFNLDKGYAFTAFEQEAYLHERDSDYLKHRKPYAWIKYVFKKKKLWLTSPEILSENCEQIQLQHRARNEAYLNRRQAV